MNFKWHFKEATPGDRARETQVEKFFNSDAVANKANAIVREGIQNSLDAAPDNVSARVRITVGAWPAEETAKRLKRYFDGFEEHFEVGAVQLKIKNRPNFGEEFRYLVFEDFGTSGLTGDETMWWPDEHGHANPFFNYFRGEGISEKAGGARGRHGVGRLVFMFASRVRSIFGLTRRANGGEGDELLMGTSVLRNHRLADKPYLPDAWFGVEAEPKRGLILPIRDDRFLQQFKSDFQVSRKNESGLSVVVPWLDVEVSAAKVVEAVLTGYYYPILRGSLIVEVIDEANALKTISAETIELVAAEQQPEVASRIRPLLDLAKSSIAATDRIELPSPPEVGAPKLDSTIITEDLRKAIEDRLESGSVVPIRVHMRVRPRGAPSVSCFFDVFVQREIGLKDGEIQFIREGIIISDVRRKPVSGLRAIVVIEQGPLATFLGDSENPSHTQWQKETIKDSYILASAHIEYVAQSVPSILAVISRQQKKPDTSLLIDLFSLPADEGVKTKQKKKKPKSGGQTEEEEIVIAKTPRPYKVEKKSNGFTVKRGDEGAKRPARLDIKVAYGVRRGNAFARYNAADFRIGLGGIKVTPVGCSVKEFDLNWMEIKVEQDDFEVAVTGFDTSHRDLHVDVKVKDEGEALGEGEAADERKAADATAI